MPGLHSTLPTKMTDHFTAVRACLDVGSFGALLAWWVGAAPSIATTLTVVWVSFCIVEFLVKYYKKFKKKRSGSQD